MWFREAYLGQSSSMSCFLHLVWVLLISYCAAMEISQPSAPVQSTVIIIGAGISGIMAAKTLSDNGVTDFLILEATDRIGGRMRQADFAGYTIELGANWIEGVGGERKNPIWNLAQQNDLRVFYENVSGVTFNVYSQEGERLPESMVVDRFKVASVSYNYTATLGTTFNANGEEDISILTAQRLFGFVPTTPLDMLIDFYNYDAEIAEPPRVTSLKNVQPNPTFQHFGKDEYFVADNRGYSYLVDQLAKGFLEHDTGGFKDSRLKLRKVVRSIDYSYDGVKIELEDNSMYNATYAILSVSLGVLNSNLITFKPDLPYWKIKTSLKFDMSIFTKIFLKFPYTFWPTGPGTEVFLYADRKRGYYPFWKHLEEEYPGSNILFVLVTDNESRRIEQQSDNETKAEIMEVLRTLFGADVPQIEDILVPRWWQNRFFGGSYINWPIGVSVQDFDRMKAPVGPLYFTGEHTSEKFNGYVHGAYFSGIATAQTLLDCINKGHCNETTSDGFPWDQASFIKSERRLQNKEQFDSCIGSCCTEVLKVLQQQKC